MQQKGKKFLSDLKLYSDYFKWNEKENRYETWEEACASIINGHKIKYADHVEKLSPYLNSVYESLVNKNVLASQRNLQYRYPEIEKENSRMYNCFGKETSFITDKGVFKFEDLNDGDIVNVWTHEGRWKPAKVRCYGKQKLNKISFQKNSNFSSVRATGNHRWILNNGDITDNIKIGDKLIQSKEIFNFNYDQCDDPFKKLYWCYGYVFGDGTKVKNNNEYTHSMVRLCGHQIKYAYRFEEMGFKSSSSLSLGGDLMFYTGKYLKTIPDINIDSLELLEAFICGYLDADALKNRNSYGKKYICIQTSTEENIEFLRKFLPSVGFFILSETDLTGELTNYGVRGKTIKFSITNCCNINAPFKVINIEEDSYEDVWCLEVDDDMSFTLSNGIVTGNCVSSHVMRNRFFQEAFYLGLCGCGVGASLLIPFVKHLSKIKKRVNGTKTYVIQDSIIGWADALGVLLSSYFIDNQPFPEFAGSKIRFDYSQIRSKGSLISGGFKAPGHEGLKQSLENIEKLLDNWIDTEGEVIRPILAFDIICFSADSVLSGGIRRSALNMLVDPNDEEMIMAKTGNWRQENPQRARSNNSVLILRKDVDKEYFKKIVNLNDGDNDIGFAFVNSWFDTYNPCFEISKLPVLVKTDFSKIHYNEIFDFTTNNFDKFGWQQCNLCEINAEAATTKDKFLKFCKDAAVLGTLQAGYTSFPYLGEVTEQIGRREALLGVSITGWMNNPKLFNPELLKEGANLVKKTNKEIAKIIGINPAARTTTVKPSGNASVILGTASGIHPDHSERFFRIMQLNKETNTAKWLKENMEFLLEESVWSATNSDYVVFVPIENPKNGLFKKDMYGIKHLELIKLVQENWVREGTDRELSVYDDIHHNVSSTVIIDNKEEMIDYILENKHIFNAVSFLSNYGDKDFNQAPFTSVLSLEELVESYGKAVVFASGLIVDGLHYFDNNLWLACDLVMDNDERNPIIGTREQVLLRKYWIKRAKKFAKNYFGGDVKKMVYCLKDVHLFHKWENINREFRSVDFSKILSKPEYKEISEYGALSCSGGACEITKI